ENVHFAAAFGGADRQRVGYAEIVGGGEAEVEAGGAVAVLGGVDAVAAEENVIARFAVKDVVATAAGERVVAGAADQRRRKRGLVDYIIVARSRVGRNPLHRRR